MTTSEQTTTSAQDAITKMVRNDIAEAESTMPHLGMLIYAASEWTARGWSAVEVDLALRQLVIDGFITPTRIHPLTFEFEYRAV
jgi:hypothetical protein